MPGGLGSIEAIFKVCGGYARAEGGAGGAGTAGGGGAGTGSRGPFAVALNAVQADGPLVAGGPTGRQVGFAVSVTPKSLTWDSSGSLINDCSATFFDRTAMPADLPPEDGDAGTITFSGHGGNATGVTPAIDCIRSLRTPIGILSYHCGSFLVGSSEQLFTISDSISVSATGGAEVPGFTLVAPTRPPRNVPTNDRLSQLVMDTPINGSMAWDPSNPSGVTFRFHCVDEAGVTLDNCNPIVSLTFSASDGMSPFNQRWALITCSTLNPPCDATTHTCSFNVPFNKQVSGGSATRPVLEILGRFQWTQISSTLLHLGAPVQQLLPDNTEVMSVAGLGTSGIMTR